MRDTDTMRHLLCTVAAVAIGMLLTAAPVLAEDDDDEPVRETGIMSNLMKGLGASDGSNGINYRERSPLVVPRNLTLPQPQSKRPEAANWPKDPDVLERRAAREAIRKRDKAKEQDLIQAERVQPEPELGSARARTATVSPQPGANNDERRSLYEGGGLLSPSQLGIKPGGGLFDVFGTKREDPSNIPFKGEPTRESLTMPPAGYQTPAAGSGYGMSDQDKARLIGGQRPEDVNPSGILPPGKF